MTRPALMTSRISIRHLLPSTTKCARNLLGRIQTAPDHCAARRNILLALRKTHWSLGSMTPPIQISASLAAMGTPPCSREWVDSLTECIVYRAKIRQFTRPLCINMREFVRAHARYCTQWCRAYRRDNTPARETLVREAHHGW
jgi:hypothetical protein